MSPARLGSVQSKAAMVVVERTMVCSQQSGGGVQPRSYAKKLVLEARQAPPCPFNLKSFTIEAFFLQMSFCSPAMLLMSLDHGANRPIDPTNLQTTSSMTPRVP